jgi:hypothetical protein
MRAAVRANDIYIQQLRSVSEILTQRIEGLDNRLPERPGARLNPPGFIYWHVLRVWDHDLRDLRGGSALDDIWHRNGFTAETDYEPAVTRGDDGADYADGYNYDDAQVDAVPYDADWLARYHRLLLDETIAWLEGVELDFARPIALVARAEQTTAAETLDHLIIHSSYHVGELQMTRGLLGIIDE